MKKLKEEGITLILAGVTISILNGQNGLLERTEKTAELYEKAEQNELSEINSITSQFDNIAEEEYILTDIYVSLYSDGTLAFSSNDNNLEDKTLLESYGNIKKINNFKEISSSGTYLTSAPWRKGCR